MKTKDVVDDVATIVDDQIALLTESAQTIVDRDDRAPSIERLKAQVRRVWWQVLLLVLPDEDELIWHVGGTEESCATCRGYDNETRTVSEWRELAAQGLHPNGIALDCLGYYCQCTLSPA